MTSILPLSDAVWTRLQSDPTVLAFDNPNYTTPTSGQWWVYYPEGGTRTNNRAGGILTDLRWGFQLVCVGRSRRQAENVRDRADALINFWQPNSNSATSVFREEENGDLVKPDVGDPIGPRFILTRQYRLTTRS